MAGDGGSGVVAHVDRDYFGWHLPSGICGEVARRVNDASQKAKKTPKRAALIEQYKALVASGAFAPKHVAVPERREAKPDRKPAVASSNVVRSEREFKYSQGQIRAGKASRKLRQPAYRSRRVEERRRKKQSQGLERGVRDFQRTGPERSADTAAAIVAYLWAAVAWGA